MSDLKDSGQDELLTMLEQMQDEIEALRSENEQLKQTPSSSSEISELKSLLTEVQSESKRKSLKISQQEQTIQQLNAKIESLNNSDLQLSEAKKLKEKSEQMVRNYKEDAEKARIEANKAILDADERVWQVEEREKAVVERETILSDIEAEVKNRALVLTDQKIKDLKKDYDLKNDDLKKQYESMTNGYKGRYYMSLYYGIVVTVLMALMSGTFRKETTVFFTVFFDGLLVLCQGIGHLCEWIGTLGDKIPQKVIAVIVHWVLKTGIGAVAFVGICFFIIWCVSEFVKFFKEHYADEKTAAIMLMTLAVIVICVDFVSLLPINVILLYIMIFVVYIIVRAFWEWEDEDTKKDLLINVGLIVLAAFILCFGLHTLSQDLKALQP